MGGGAARVRRGQIDDGRRGENGVSAPILIPAHPDVDDVEMRGGGAIGQGEG
eukprot:m.13608 g.13608  ORF g.13608 m.13608 type:complete len:52 (-) comp8172_c0_seq1:72-227(-)